MTSTAPPPTKKLKLANGTPATTTTAAPSSDSAPVPSSSSKKKRKLDNTVAPQDDEDLGESVDEDATDSTAPEKELTKAEKGKLKKRRKEEQRALVRSRSVSLYQQDRKVGGHQKRLTTAQSTYRRTLLRSRSTLVASREAA